MLAMLGRKARIILCCGVFFGMLFLAASAQAVVTPTLTSPANGAIFYTVKKHEYDLNPVAMVSLRFTCDDWGSGYFTDVSKLRDGDELGPGVFSGFVEPDSSKTNCKSDNFYGYTAGTYYWRAYGIDCSIPSCERSSEIRTFTVKDPPPPTPDPDPVPDPDLDTYMTRSNAVHYARQQTRQHFKRRPYRVNCWRRNYSSFGCFSFYRKNWRNRFRAKLVFKHVVEDNTIYYYTSLKGRRWIGR